LTALHGGQPVLETGQPLEQATAAMVLLHGRGASAADIMTVGEAVQQPGFAYLAPQAAGSAWYPNPFTAPLESNEPWLSSALETVERLLERVEERLPASQVILLGFSQGACLALEFAARHARRYGGVVGLSGALIGPDDAPRDYPGSLAGTPVLLGCSDADPYVSAGLVRRAARSFDGWGARSTSVSTRTLAMRSTMTRSTRSGR
jgi:phospholipase/carboxylesterase